MKSNLQSIITKLDQLNLNCTTSHVFRIWNSFDELSIQRIRKMNTPVFSISNNGKTVVIEYWEIENFRDSWTIEIEDCHISDDSVACYYEGLALLLNEIKSDILIVNNFYFGLVYNEEDDEMFYDVERYLEELEPELVVNIVNLLD